MTTPDLAYLIIAFIAWVPLTAIGFYKTGYMIGYHRGRRKGLHDGWALAQDGRDAADRAAALE